MDNEHQSKTPEWAVALSSLRVRLSEEFLGGPKVLRMAWVINFQKGATILFVWLLMMVYGNFSPAAWVYLGLHGAYGLVWLIKDRAFPDERWKIKITLGGAVLSFLLVLGPYWVAPWLLIAGISHQPTALVMGISTGMHTLGLALMIGADAQKYFTLRLKRGLITDGLYRQIRHPNYLGEMLIYGSYALLAQHWLPWAILAFVWLLVFLPNMMMIEASLSRYAEWAAYRQQSGLLLPKIMFTKTKATNRRQVEINQEPGN